MNNEIRNGWLQLFLITVFFFRFQENKQHMKEKAQAMISRERQVKQALDDFEQRQKNYNEQTVSS